MNKHYMNLGQYNNRHVIKHVNLKIKENDMEGLSSKNKNIKDGGF